MLIYIEQAYEMLDAGIFVSRFREDSGLGHVYHKIVKDGEEYQIIACNQQTNEEEVTWRYPLNQLARLLREHYIELDKWTYEQHKQEVEHLDYLRQVLNHKDS